VGGQGHAPTALPPGKRPGNVLCSMLGGPQGLSGRVRKISPPSEFDRRAVQPVASGYIEYNIQDPSATGSSVNLLTVLRTGWRGNRGSSPGGEEFFFSSPHHPDRRGYKGPAMRWEQQSLSGREKRLGSGANHPLLRGVDIKNAWSYTTTFP
jgi:hypothetical protein